MELAQSFAQVGAQAPPLSLARFRTGVSLADRQRPHDDRLIDVHENVVTNRPGHLDLSQHPQTAKEDREHWCDKQPLPCTRLIHVQQSYLSEIKSCRLLWRSPTSVERPRRLCELLG